MSNKKRIVIAVLCLIGLILSIDLIYIYIKTSFIVGAAKSFCSINSLVDCDGVASTKHAFFLGVPLAIWGVILYLLFLFLDFVDKIREKINFPLLNVFKNPQSYIATIGFFSFLCSMSLAYISLHEIHKICILCFCTYILNFLIALCAVKKDFFITDIKTTVLDFISGVREYTTLFLVVCLVVVSLLGFFQKSLILAPKLKLDKAFDEIHNMKENIYQITGNNLGNPDGDVGIYIFGDFMCPSCRDMNIVLHKLVLEDKNVGVFHVNFPLDSECNPTVRHKIHPGACLLAKYALAAQEQGNYWGMVSLIYNKRPNSEKEILMYAKQIGLDPDELKKTAYSPKTAEYLENQVYRGIGEGMVATPTLMIDGIPHSGFIPDYKLKELIKQSRTRHKNEQQK